MKNIIDLIESAFGQRAKLTPANAPAAIREAVDAALGMLDSGEARVAEPRGPGDWVVNEWLKKAVLLSFRLQENRPIPGGHTQYYDKVAAKFGDSSEADLLASCYRRSLEIATENALATVAFPAISTGIYRFPPDAAAQIAIDTTAAFLANDRAIHAVIFCCFDPASLTRHERAIAAWSDARRTQ